MPSVTGAPAAAVSLSQDRAQEANRTSADGSVRASSKNKEDGASPHLPSDTGPAVTGFGSLFSSLHHKGLLTGV